MSSDEVPRHFRISEKGIELGKKLFKRYYDEHEICRFCGHLYFEHHADSCHIDKYNKCNCKREYREEFGWTSDPIFEMRLSAMLDLASKHGMA